MAVQPASSKGQNKNKKKVKNQQPQKSVGRPKKSFFRKAPKQFKELATGETRNSPFTDPNIIFMLGIGLILASGWSSGRLKELFALILFSPANLARPGELTKQFRIILVQVLFVFLLTITGRAIPPLARIWLVVIIGMWLLWIMRNPEMLKLLNEASKD